MGRPVKIGLLGTGFAADTSHMPALKEIPDADVVALAARTQGRAVEFGDKWGIKKRYYGEDGIDLLCRDPAVDVVLITLPNDLHLRAITAAAENHKDVICEKPLARDASEAKRALDVVRRYDVMHCYAENQVFIPQIVRAQKLIRNGAIGRVTWVRSREAHSGPHRSWFRDPTRAGGGVLLDMGCHSIEVARRLFDRKPLAVSAWTETLVHRIKVEDNSLVLVKYEGRGLGQSENSWSSLGGLDVRFEVYGSEGSVFIDTTRETGIRVFTTAREELTGYIVEKADVKQGWTFPAWGEHITYGYLDQMRHFIRAISTRARALETFEDGYLVNRIIETAYRSSRESRWISLK